MLVLPPLLLLLLPPLLLTRPVAVGMRPGHERHRGGRWRVLYHKQVPYILLVVLLLVLVVVVLALVVVLVVLLLVLVLRLLALLHSESATAADAPPRRTLGPEFGGSLGVLWYLANCISVAFYMLGLAEPIVRCAAWWSWWCCFWCWWCWWCCCCCPAAAAPNCRSCCCCCHCHGHCYC